MKRSKIILAIILSVVLIVGLIIGVMNSYAEGYFFNVKADTYNVLDRSYQSGYNLNLTHVDSGENNISTILGAAFDNIVFPTTWYPSVAANTQYNNAFSGDNQKSYIDFKLTGNTAFGDLNGYNGAVSFAWYYNDNLVENAFLPASMHYLNYSRDIKFFDYFYKMGGGLGPEIAEKPNTTGAVITFYPANNGTGIGGSYVTHFRIFIRKTPSVLSQNQLPYFYTQDYEIYEGDFSGSGINLAVMTRVELDRMRINDGSYAIQFRVGQANGGSNIVNLENMQTLSYRQITREEDGFDGETLNLNYRINESNNIYYSVTLDPTVSEFAYNNQCFFNLSLTAAWNRQPEIFIYDFH